MSAPLNWKVGLELEGTAVTKECTPVDLRPYFSNRIKYGEYAGVMLDGERDQIELVTDPTMNLGSAVKQFHHMHAEALRWLLCGEMQILFVPRRPAHLPLASFEGWTKLRLQALRQAVCDNREGGLHGERIVRSGDINAFHIHFGVGDVCSDEGTMVMNLLNVAAPTVLEWVHNAFRIPRVERNAVWTKFVRPERLPAPRWFKNFKDLHRFFESYPRLIRPVDLTVDKHGGVWEVDLESPQVFGDPACEGTTYWTVRPRPAYQTVEFRPLPSLPDFQCVVPTVEIISNWLERALIALQGRQFGSFDEALGAGIIPDFAGRPLPINEVTWWQRWATF